MTEKIGQLNNIFVFFRNILAKKCRKACACIFLNRYHNVYPMLSGVVKNLSESTVRISRQQEYRTCLSPLYSPSPPVVIASGKETPILVSFPFQNNLANCYILPCELLKLREPGSCSTQYLDEEIVILVEFCFQILQ